MLHISGVVTVSYSQPAANEIVIDYVGNDLHVNKAFVNWTAHSDITAATALARHMVWSAKLTGTTARGRPLQRSNTMTLDWVFGQECVKVQGKSDGNLTSVEVHTDVIDFQRCGGQCPAPGGEVKITNVATGRFVDIKFDGTNQAEVTTTSSSFTIGLACGL
jgi:hypothetical protein